MRLLSLLLALAACSAEPDRPGEVTADEARELDEAAELPDDDSLDPDDAEDEGEQDQGE